MHEMSDDIDDIKMPDIAWAVGHYFNLYVSLQGVDGRTCDFEPLEHVPRTSARTYTCAVVFWRAPCVLRSREHEIRPAAGREKNVNVPKKHIYT